MSRILRLDEDAARPATWPSIAPPAEPVPEARAEAEAAEVLAAAHREADAIRTSARAAARAEGLRIGRSEAASAARAEVEAVLAEARHVLEEAWEERRRVVEGALDDAVELALEVARRILERELAEAPEEVLALAQSLVRRAGEGHVVLHAHPAEAGIVEAQRDSLGADVEVRADPSVPPSGLVAESETGVLDATLEKRVSRLESSVREVAARERTGRG